MLTFKRDALVHQFVERTVIDDLSLRLFFDELVSNVVSSTYPAAYADAVLLAAINLRLHHVMGPSKHTITYEYARVYG